jgi:hypothetical protein
MSSSWAAASWALRSPRSSLPITTWLCSRRRSRWRRIRPRAPRGRCSRPTVQHRSGGSPRAASSGSRSMRRAGYPLCCGVDLSGGSRVRAARANSLGCAPRIRPSSTSRRSGCIGPCRWCAMGRSPKPPSTATPTRSTFLRSSTGTRHLLPPRARTSSPVRACSRPGATAAHGWSRPRRDRSRRGSS